MPEPTPAAPVAPRYIKAEGDEQSGMTYLTLVEVEAGGVVRTEDRGPVHLDYNADGVLVGVELDGLLGPILTHGTLAGLFPEWFANESVPQPAITQGERNV